VAAAGRAVGGVGAASGRTARRAQLPRICIPALLSTTPTQRDRDALAIPALDASGD
jgi:hypothetical protein